MPCELRKGLPDLVFGIGGQNFTLTAFDYAPEMEDGAGGSMCSLEIYSTEGEYPVNAIVLGKQFLSAYYRYVVLSPCDSSPYSYAVSSIWMRG